MIMFRFEKQHPLARVPVRFAQDDMTAANDDTVAQAPNAANTSDDVAALARAV